MPNRLAGEQSPYLLAHADNPVDWYPWGDEAFDRAQAEDKPVFLSIGYAACHWCHVMERESFVDPGIAGLLNDGFISIKVDREERPDVDHVYMTACQLLTGQGGWPLSVFLTPDRLPFYAGTYFPPRARWGRPGFSELLSAIDKAWNTEREGLVEAGTKIADAIQSANPADEGELDPGIFDSAVSQLKQGFDPEYGGFGRQPKFPMPSNLLFLLRRHVRGDARAEPMVERTLAAMYRGGMFDHVGFGFARYSTDRKWLVPHFEKMLYDNAQLALAYTEAHQALRRGLYGRVARWTLEYMDRELSHPDGGFCSAQDADTDCVEGATYLWTPAEIRDAVPAGQRWSELYGVTEDGNFEGKSILNLLGHGISDDEVLAGLVPDPDDRELEDVRRKLLEVRRRRPQPLLDDKVLAGWNGLAIAAFSRAARVFDYPGYLDRARQAYEFVTDRMIIDGRLQARYRSAAGIPGFLPDYSFFVWGCLELYESSHRPEYLGRALELTDDMLRLFSGDGPGLYLAGRDAEQVLGRPVDLDDGAIPSGNSVALYDLLRLWQLTGDGRFRDAADGIIRAAATMATQHPTGFTFWLSAAELAYFPTTEVVVSGDGPAGRDLIRVVHQRYLPSVSLVVRDGEAAELERYLPSVRDIPQTEEAVAYVCSGGACGSPIRDADELARRLDAGDKMV